MTERRSLVRRSWFWWCGSVVALLAAAAAWWMFPKAHALLTLDLRMDRAAAVRAAEDLARTGKWGPEGEVRSVAMFGGDDYVQAFVELAGGGKPAFAALVQDPGYAPYRWNVRRFREGETREVEVRFRPEGRPVGFKETLAQGAPGAALPADEARAIAEAAARAAPWAVALDQFTPFGTSTTTQPGGRVDHAFTYERRDGALGEGRLRLVLVVSGDRLTSLTHYVHIPEAFGRRYAEMRSINHALASASLGGAALLYGVGGIGIGVFILLRQRQVWWRPALAAAAVFGLLNLLQGLNAWPLGWAQYDTARRGSRWARRRAD